MRNASAAVALFVTFLLSHPMLAQSQAAPANEPSVTTAESAIGRITPNAQPDGSFALPLCRLLDTRYEPTGVGSAKGRIDVTATRCAAMVPENATAYSLLIRTYGWSAPEHAPNSAPPVTSTTRVPAPHDGVIHFPVTGAGFMTVDLQGYYLPPGRRPSGPGDQAAGAGPASASATIVDATQTHSVLSGRPVANIVKSGTAGDVILDGSASGFGGSGVFLSSTSAYPWMALRTGGASNVSGMLVFNSNNSELFKVQSNGVVVVPASGSISSRSDYWAYAPNVPSNVIHNVTLLDPRDAAGGNTTPLTFFKAESVNESASPAITKYLAVTDGYYDRPNISFDSQLYFHTPGQYHFRAYSKVETKDTFWVKPATSGTSTSGTRADMYVSGRVGIGTPTPMAPLEVVGQLAVSGSGASRGRLQMPFADWAGMSVNASYGTAAGVTGWILDDATRPAWIMKTDSRAAAGGDVFGVLRVPAGAGAHTNETQLLTLTAAGDLSVYGRIGARYQDVAEWVDASNDLEPGTVVILDATTSNQVTTASSSYDTTVAGVVSAQPGIILGEGGVGKEQVATTGRVKVNVDATSGPISIGDLLVTSNEPGFAMKSVPVEFGGMKMHRPGTIIGKALEPLASGKGQILVLLSMQ